ncbi:MAG: hypothetical protein ACRDS9_24125 [Pseudonocardiaceae bacterium]
MAALKYLAARAGLAAAQRLPGLPRALPLPAFAVSALVRRLSVSSAAIDEPADHVAVQLRRRH